MVWDFTHFHNILMACLKIHTQRKSAAERKSLQSQFYYLVTSQWPTTKVLIFNNLSALEFQGNEDLIGWFKDFRIFVVIRVLRGKNWLLDSIEDILILKKPWVILHYDTNEHFQSSVLTRNPLFKHQHGSLRIEEIQNLFKKILECGHKMIGIQV